VDVVLKKLGPVGISAILCSLFVIAAAVGFAATRSGGGNDPATAAPQSAFSAQPGTRSEGDALLCPGGGLAATAYSQVGSEFRIVGKVASVDGAQLLVKGPERYVKVTVAQGVTIANGEIIRASGTLDREGNAQATEIEPACSSAAVVVAVTDAPAAIQVPPEPTSTAGPTLSPAAPTPRAFSVVAAVSVEEESAEPTSRPTRTPGRVQPAGRR
jgi:uncharacterized Zn-binding protein involved in type VI secretion